MYVECRSFSYSTPPHYSQSVNLTTLFRPQASLKIQLFSKIYTKNQPQQSQTKVKKKYTNEFEKYDFPSQRYEMSTFGLFSWYRKSPFFWLVSGVGWTINQTAVRNQEQ